MISHGFWLISWKFAANLVCMFADFVSFFSDFSTGLADFSTGFANFSSGFRGDGVLPRSLFLEPLVPSRFFTTTRVSLADYLPVFAAESLSSVKVTIFASFTDL